MKIFNLEIIFHKPKPKYEISVDFEVQGYTTQGGWFSIIKEINKNIDRGAKISIKRLTNYYNKLI